MEDESDIKDVRRVTAMTSKKRRRTMMASLSPRVADDVAAGDQVVHELPALSALRAQ